MAAGSYGLIVAFLDDFLSGCSVLNRWKSRDKDYSQNCEFVYFSFISISFCFPHFAVLLFGAYVCLYMHAQSCLTFWNPVDCSQPGPSVHGTFEARILKWFGISSSRGSSRFRDRTFVSCISCIGRQILYHWATQESLHLRCYVFLVNWPFLVFFFYYYIMCLSLVIFFALKSTLSDINGAIPDFFWSALYDLHFSILLLFTSLYHYIQSEFQHIVRSCFLSHSSKLGLLIGVVSHLHECSHVMTLVWHFFLFIISVLLNFSEYFHVFLYTTIAFF